MAGKTEDQILDDAVRGTENEIFSEAFGGEADDTDGAPDTSLEQVEDDLASDTGEGDGEGKPDGEAADGDTGGEKGKTEAEDEDGEAGDKGEGGKPDPETQPRADDGKFKPKGDPHVPLSAERARRQAAEATLETERTERAAERERIAKLEGTLEQLLRQQAQQPAKAVADDKSKIEAEVEPEPDIFTDPDKWKEWNSKQADKRVEALKQSFDDRFINQSMARAHEQHGEVFEAAYKALSTLDRSIPENAAVLKRIRTAPDPGSAAMRWHKGELTRKEVGDDVGAFKEKLRAETRDALMKDPEFRKQLIASMRDEASGGGNPDTGGKPRLVIRNPKSLNSEGGRAERVSDDVDNDASDQAIFKSAFA